MCHGEEVGAGFEIRQGKQGRTGWVMPPMTGTAGTRRMARNPTWLGGKPETTKPTKNSRLWKLVAGAGSKEPPQAAPILTLATVQIPGVHAGVHQTDYQLTGKLGFEPPTYPTNLSALLQVPAGLWMAWHNSISNRWATTLHTLVLMRGNHPLAGKHQAGPIVSPIHRRPTIILARANRNASPRGFPAGDLHR